MAQTYSEIRIKRKFLLLLFICALFYCAAILSSKNSMILGLSHRNQTHANAFIISTNCSSTRFNFTKNNIERVFPIFFRVYCFPTIPLNDTRINQSLTLLQKKLSSNLLTFVTLWTQELPKFSKRREFEWSFIFEDDVNFVEPSNFFLPNFINPLKQLMHHPQIQYQDGMFYLGICGPKFLNNASVLVAPFSKNSLISRRGCGNCAHAMGFTAKGAKDLWMNISSFLTFPTGPADIYLHRYCSKIKQTYVLGANLQWPRGSGHYGIAFQDRQHFRSEIW